jgi:hypothetical protein
MGIQQGPKPWRASLLQKGDQTNFSPIETKTIVINEGKISLMYILHRKLRLCFRETTMTLSKF